MDGVLLAGGLASRLGPITKVTNKHLLPIYDKPMIFYGIELLRDLGCERIIIILGGNSVGDIVNLVRDGSQFGVEVIYKFQNEPKGISHAIGLTQDIIEGEQDDQYVNKRFLVLLGDNIFTNTKVLKKAVDKWLYELDAPRFAIFVKESSHPHDYGQPVYNDRKRMIKIVEKDSTITHNKIITGLYGLDCMVFEDIKKQKPSMRGEYEITDTLSRRLPYITTFNHEGFWSDCGTPEGLIETAQYMKEKDRNEDTSKR